MKNKFKKESIAIKDLRLWDENPRFPEEYFNKSEKQLISFLLKKKDFKIEHFAHEVVNDFDLPPAERLIVYSFKGKNIVMEGNRRLVVYKLLANPNLVSDLMSSDIFQNLSREVKITGSFKLDVIVTNDREVALRYIDRKHTKKNNEVNWGEQERNNYKVRRGNATAKKEKFRYEIGKLVRSLDVPDEMKESILGRGFITTFYRLVDSDPGLRVLGIEKSEDGSILIKKQKETKEKLKIIIFDILTKREIEGERLNSRFLNKSEKKEEYLESLGSDDKRRVSESIKKSISTNIFGEQYVNITTEEGKAIYNARKENYNSIINPDLPLPSVQSEKIKEIFSELQIINAKKCPTAAALLLRALMDITVSDFADKKKIRVDNDGYFRDDGGKTKQSLKEKIDYISTKFASKEVKDTVSVFNGNSLFTDNLNKIAHSRFIHSSRQKVDNLWKDSRAFWEFLVAEIIKEEKVPRRKRK